MRLRLPSGVQSYRVMDQPTRAADWMASQAPPRHLQRRRSETVLSSVVSFSLCQSCRSVNETRASSLPAMLTDSVPILAPRSPPWRSCVGDLKHRTQTRGSFISDLAKVCMECTCVCTPGCPAPCAADARECCGQIGLGHLVTDNVWIWDIRPCLPLRAVCHGCVAPFHMASASLHNVSASFRHGSQRWGGQVHDA